MRLLITLFLAIQSVFAGGTYVQHEVKCIGGYEFILTTVKVNAYPTNYEESAQLTQVFIEKWKRTIPKQCKK